MGPGTVGLLGGNHIVLYAEKVVAVLEPPVVRVQRPAAHAAALVDDHPGGGGFGRGDARGNGVRFVFQRQDAVFADPHSFEEQLAGSAYQLGSSGDVGIEALESAVIDGNDVVFDRLNQPQALHVGQLLGVLRGEVA